MGNVIFFFTFYRKHIFYRMLRVRKCTLFFICVHVCRYGWLGVGWDGRRIEAFAAT